MPAVSTSPKWQVCSCPNSTLCQDSRIVGGAVAEDCVVDCGVCRAVRRRDAEESSEGFLSRMRATLRDEDYSWEQVDSMINAYRSRLASESRSKIVQEVVNFLDRTKERFTVRF